MTTNAKTAESRLDQLGVYLAATPEFTEHPKVADAASELFRDVFGEEAVKGGSQGTPSDESTIPNFQQRETGRLLLV